MTFKKRVNKVKAALGWTEKKAFTKDETATLIEKYNEEEGADFAADMKAAQEAEAKAAQLDEAAKALAELSAKTDNDNTNTNGDETPKGEKKPDGEETPKGEEKPAGKEQPKGEEKPVDVAASITKLGQEMASMKSQLADKDKKIETLSRSLEDDKPKNETMKIEGFQLAHTPDFAFGIKNDLFSTKKRWNKIAVNQLIAKNSIPSEADEEAFKAEVSKYGAKISARYAELKSNNMLDPEKLMASTTVTFNNVDGAADAYITRRMDGLIAQILMIKKIDLFPTRYGIQDMEVIDNMLFDEVLQPWQAGKIFKGGVEIQPETGHVDDVSIKLQFEPLVEIERKYNGYLNTDGSDAIKYGLIEWFTLGIMKQAIKEQIKCIVKGLYVKPETGVAGKAINSSTGALWQFIRYAHQYKMKLIDASAYASYTSATMYDTVTAFVGAVNDVLGDDELENYTLILNAKHKKWWIQGVRADLGKDTDFAKGTGLNTVPDFDIPVYWMPAVGDVKWMFMLEAGNVQNLENKPGEMLALKFGEDFENVTVRSRSKKGLSAAFVGKRFITKALLDANNYENQRIFMNKPYVALDADATTATATTSNFWFVTIANAAATAFTDITDAVEGQPYIIECGSLTNATAIAKANKFANLTAAWTPTAVGDYLMVVINNAGTAFRELERCVGGVRSVNSATQPTLPEARS